MNDAFIVVLWGDSESAIAGVFTDLRRALEHIQSIDSPETTAEHCHVEQWECGGDRVALFDTHLLVDNGVRTITLEERR